MIHKPGSGIAASFETVQISTVVELSSSIIHNSALSCEVYAPPTLDPATQEGAAV